MRWSRPSQAVFPAINVKLYAVAVALDFAEPMIAGGAWALKVASCGLMKLGISNTAQN
jgi:hypothetical protein